MSTTTFTAASPHAVKLWARKAFNDSVKATLFGQLTGKSDRSVVQVKDDELKNEGDRVTFRLRSLPTGLGVQDDETLEGKEEGLDYKSFNLNLGEKRQAIKVDLNLSAQRTMANVRQDAKDALNEWIEDYIDTTFFEYLTGISSSAASATGKYHPSGALGGNALSAPSSNRLIYGGTGVTAKASLAATDVMTLSVLDKAAERVKLAQPTMRKARFNGKDCYPVILHPYQVNDLRASTSSLQWGDITKASMQGGGENLFAGEILGMYRDMALIESTRIPTFADYGAGANIKAARALFLGAQAAVVAHGKDTDEWGKLALKEREFDYGKRYGVAATMIWGIQKSTFNGQDDFGVFAIDTAAQQHN